MKRKKALYWLLGISILLAYLLAMGVLPAGPAIILFAAALAVLGVMSRGFKK
jgi:hypothetical protein